MREKWQLFKTEAFQLVNEKGTKKSTKLLLGNYYSNTDIPHFLEVHIKQVHFHYGRPTIVPVF